MACCCKKTKVRPFQASEESPPSNIKMSSYGDEQVLVEPLSKTNNSRSVFNRFIRPCVAEFVGTTLFVFIGTMAVQLAPAEFTGVAIAHGLTIALLVAGLGPISGGHFNPAVSLGALIGGGLEPVLFPCYLISQVVGGILGASICRGVLGSTVYVAIGGGGHQLGSGVSLEQGVLCEVVLTIVLVLCVLTTAVDTDGTSVIHPLAIGFAVAADICAGIKVTGASMNPARSFGPAVAISGMKAVSGHSVSLWTDHWVYWLGPAIGSTLAGLLYRLILAKSEKRLILKED